MRIISRCMGLCGLLGLCVATQALARTAEGAVPDSLLGLYALLASHPLLAPLLFVLAYALGITLLLPGILFCLLGGVLFGPWLGAILNVAGATLGASLAFMSARHLAAGLVERHLNRTLQRLKEGVELEGWRFVALMRLMPIVPYDLSNYAFGLCRLPLGQFAATTALCLLPRLTVYTYIGHSGLSLLGGKGDQLMTLLTIFSLLIAVLLLPLLYRRLYPPLRQ